MKVVHLISGGDIGGAKTHIEMLLSKLNTRSDIQVWLLCVIESVLSDECRRRGINVKIIPQKRRYDISSMWKIADWIKEENFDIIHCHGARANFIALFLRLKIKKPMVTTIHSDYMLDFKGSNYKRWVYTPLNILSLKRFKHYITISEMFKQMLILRGFKENEIDVIYNGIDFEKIPDVTDKDKFLNKYGVNVNKETVIIGCVARLHPVKGVDVLLKACTLLFNENDSQIDAVVLIAGSGDEKSALESYVLKNKLLDKVKFLGHVKDIDSFYNALDINVLPSVSEGFGLALIEGARFKLSSIGTKTGGIQEIIEHNETGMMFEVHNHNELYKLILENIMNRQAGIIRGERLYEVCASRFSDVIMAERHMVVYKTLMGIRQ